MSPAYEMNYLLAFVYDLLIVLEAMRMSAAYEMNCLLAFTGDAHVCGL